MLNAFRVQLRKLWLVVGVMTAAALASNCGAADAVNASRIVENAQQLTAALKTGPDGRVIRLAPGNYGDVSIRNIKGAGLTIVAADPTSRPVFSSINILGSSGLTVRDLDIVMTASPGLAIGVSERVRVEGVLIQGLQTAEDIGQGNGVVIRRSRDVAVTGSELRNLGNAISHGDSEQILIKSNRIHGIRVDGVHGGGTSDITIASNVFWNFSRREGEHPDGIQFWTKNAKASASKIRILNNLIMRGEGGKTQGVFISDQTKGRLPYLDLVVRGNAVVGAGYHGLTVSGATSPIVEDNLVIGYDDNESWLAVDKSSDAVIRNNRATSYRVRENKGESNDNNKKIKGAKVGDARGLRAWYDAAKADLPQLPPELLAQIR